MSEDLLEFVRPAWILIAIAGCFWASAYSALRPPPFRSVFIVYLAGLAGAGIGQIVAEAASVRDVILGDAHLVIASIASLLLVAVVRRLVA
jgi:hypothetical protein